MQVQTVIGPRAAGLTVAMIGIAAVGIGPALAQQDVTQDAAARESILEIDAVEYAFLKLPDTVPTGTQISLRNIGTEFHELMVVRVADGTTASPQELLAIGGEVVARGMVEPVSESLFVEPGAHSETTVTLDRAGRYIVLCNIPQGLDAELVGALGVTEETDPADWPPELHAIFENPTHADAGMVRELMVLGPADPAPVPEAGFPPM